jgi:preprotein translocase subunit SecD
VIILGLNAISTLFVSQQVAQVKTVVTELQQGLPGISYAKTSERSGTLIFSEQSINT